MVCKTQQHVRSLLSTYINVQVISIVTFLTALGVMAGPTCLLHLFILKIVYLSLPTH